MNPYAKLVEFQTSSRGRDIQRYIEFFQIYPLGTPKTMDEVKSRFMDKF